MDSAKTASEPARSSWPVFWHEAIDSTNDEARRRVENGLAGPCWIAAERQSAGRGRLGRSWASPSGNLFASAVLALSDGPREAVRLPFAAAVSVARTVMACAPGAMKAGVKWPNDVRVSGAKIAGILVETCRSVGDEGAARYWAVVGIGINVASAPDGTGQDVTCLRALGAPASLTAALVLEELRRHLPEQAGRIKTDFPALLADWAELADGLGQRIQVRPGGEMLDGVFEGLEADGALRLRLDDGSARIITAGDVSLVRDRG